MAGDSSFKNLLSFLNGAASAFTMDHYVRKGVNE